MYKIREAKQAVKDGVRSYLLKDENGDYFMSEDMRLPMYMEGPPGVGKTQCVRQIASELGIGYVSFSITHHTRNSLLGLPVIKDLSDGGKYTEYTMSEVIGSVMKAREQGFKEGILLLDEFSCVSETILPTMLAFLQTKNIGRYSLPEGWVIVLCGNPVEYNRSARVFDQAITDRIRKLEIEFSAGDFIKYAVESKVHPIVISYLKTHKQHIYVIEKEKDKKEAELVTCRGWENLSKTIYAYEKLGVSIDENMVMQFIKSQNIAYSFCKYYRMQQAGCSDSDVKTILSGRRLEEYAKKWSEKDILFRVNAVDILSAAIAKEADKTLGTDSGSSTDTGISTEIDGDTGADSGINTDTGIKIGGEHKKNASEKVRAKSEMINRAVSYVFRLIEKMGDEQQLRERFYYYIGEHDNILRIVVKSRNKEYSDICARMYDLQA